MNSRSPSNHPMEIFRSNPQVMIEIKLVFPICGTPSVLNWIPKHILARMPRFSNQNARISISSRLMKEVSGIAGIRGVVCRGGGRLQGEGRFQIFGDCDPLMLVKQIRRKYSAELIRIDYESNGIDEEITCTEDIPLVTTDLDPQNWPSGDDDDDEEVYYDASDLLFEESADSYQTPSIKCNCKNGAILVLDPPGSYYYDNRPLDRLFYECPNRNKEGVLPRCDFKIAAREERSSAMLYFLADRCAELEEERDILVDAVHEKQMLQEKVVELSELNSGQEQVIEDLRKDFNNLKENIRNLI